MTGTSDENEKHTEGAGRSPAEKAQTVPKPPKLRRIPVASVADLGLSLVKVQLTSVLCIVEQAEQLSLLPSVVDLKQEGKLILGSLSSSGFRSEVSWSLDVPGMEKKPFSIAGKHVVVFATSRPATKRDSEFYSEINAIILLHPYLRQLVDDLSSKCLGQSIMVRTLDVLEFVKKKTEQFYEQQDPQAAEDK